MTSEKQILANQANAAHSTGPRTEEGKAASSRNAVKHNLTGVMTLLPGEDPDDYANFCDSLIPTYGPVGPMETHLAQAIVNDHWRIERIRRLEQIHIGNAFAAGKEPDSRTLALYTTYQSRLAREIRNNHATLRMIQKDRIEVEAYRSQTAPRTQFAAAPKPAPRPAPSGPNGFLFSREDILDLRDLGLMTPETEKYAIETYGPGFLTEDLPENQPAAA
jgi:hypothetical protein